ncbi:hypothetical protein [Novosphingobium sp.]|uniref:hypothetical protein n=1 Tax=Novosphingobium sp. TaxID=1874826 RepID=UPI00273455CC|nr:hypothetical protein [Novosphingobium sp.]MDP3905824.1 hypothetical protein [Novosphingobium sp.]
MKRQRPPNRLRRGHPLIALGLVMTAWVGARAVLRDDPAPEPVIAARAAPAVRPAAQAMTAPGPAPERQAAVRPAPVPQRPFVAAPAAAPDYERLRLAEGHQLLWQAAVAPPPVLPALPEQSATPAAKAE